MSRYIFESENRIAGVFISSRRYVPNENSKIISKRQITPLEMRAVLINDFIVVKSLLPKYLDVITEHPILHPNANAMKISVIS